MIPTDCIPNGDEMVIEVFTIPDRLGRCMFNLYWNVEHIPGHPEPKKHMVRGQCFFAPPSEYTKKNKIGRLIDRGFNRTINYDHPTKPPTAKACVS